MMKKIPKLIILFLLALALPLYAADFKKPVIPTLEDLKEAYPTLEKIEATLKPNASAEQFFKAGLYYFFEAANVDFGTPLRKGIQKKYNERAITLFEAATKMAPKNPYHLVMLGNAYGFQVTFAGFPAFLRWAGQCRSTLEKAVDLDPHNPEIRMGRLRSNVHFPYQYYASVKQEVLEDYEKVEKWIQAATSQGTKLSPEKHRYFSDLEDELNYWAGYYFFTEVKDSNAARSYLTKINPKSKVHRLAHNILRKM